MVGFGQSHTAARTGSGPLGPAVSSRLLSDRIGRGEDPSGSALSEDTADRCISYHLPAPPASALAAGRCTSLGARSSFAPRKAPTAEEPLCGLPVGADLKIKHLAVLVEPGHRVRAVRMGGSALQQHILLCRCNHQVRAFQGFESFVHRRFLLQVVFSIVPKCPFLLQSQSSWTPRSVEYNAAPTASSSHPSLIRRRCTVGRRHSPSILSTRYKRSPFA